MKKVLMLLANFGFFASAQQFETLIHYIPSPVVGGLQSGANFGSSVAADGDYVVVGAPSDDIGEIGAGVVKVYNATTGELLFILPNPEPENSDQFGLSVAISGTRVAVGAELDNAGASNAGSAYVFDISSTTPTVPIATLHNPNPNLSYQFGNSVAISGTRVVVGDPFYKTGTYSEGRAYVYDTSSATPEVPVIIFDKPATSTLSSDFGASVAISGNRVVVGAPGDSTGASQAGRAYVFDLGSPTPAMPVFTINNPDMPTAPGDYGGYFGNDVAISGTRLVIGANRNETVAYDEGSAFVYDLSSATPTVPVVTLNNPAPAFADYFGSSVAIFGTRIVIGSQEDGNSAGSLDVGSAYVYDLTSPTPSVPVASFGNPYPAEYDFFGSSVAMSATRVFIGASQDDTGATNAGSVYIYDLTSGTPSMPVTTLNDPGPTGRDEFGNSVAISGSRMIVGAHLDNTGAGDAGSVFVYDLNSGTPLVPTLVLNNPTPASGDHFGAAIAVSDTLAVIGTPYDDTGASNAGSVYIYDLNSGSPTVPIITLNNPVPTTDDNFGLSVSIAGSMVVVGAPTDDTGASNAGSVYVYDLSGGTPTVPFVTLNNPGAAADDNFGYAVGISGSRVIVGAYRDDAGASNAGSAYTYDLNSSTPSVPVATMLNPSPSSGDRFGSSVAISGNRIVVGAYLDDFGGSDTGRAFVYDLDGLTPATPLISLSNPSRNAGDQFGTSVAISDMHVVVGTPYDDTNASDAGRTYVYDIGSVTPTAPIATLTNPSPAMGDAFGFSVAIDGAAIAVGTPKDNIVLGDKGSVYIFGPVPGINVVQSPGSVLVDEASSVDFGLVTVGSISTVQTFTITNAGSADLNLGPITIDGTSAADFTLSSLSATNIPVGAGTATFNVTFSPTAIGPRAAALHIASNVTGTQNPFDIVLTGKGVSTNANLSFLSMSAGTLTPAFATDMLNYTVSVPNAITTLTVSAVTAEPLASVQIRVNGGNYDLPGTGLALAVGANTIEVKVTAQDGTTFKTYTITVTRAHGPVIALSGNSVGIAIGDSTPSTVDETYFGSLAIASGMSTNTFTVTNTGTVALNLTGTPIVSISGAHASDFKVSLVPNSPIAAGSSTTFQVSFDPSAMGLRSATVSVASNDFDRTPYTFAISGNGRITGQSAQTLVCTPPAKLYLAESPFTLSASTSSGLPVAYTVISGPATVLGNVLTLTGTGAVKVRASQPGNADFLAATPVERTITVAANPTTLTLTNLSQTYSGTQRPITVLGAAGAVEVTYQVGIFTVSTPPTDAGSYVVEAKAGGITKTGTLVITKAPLFVQPDDQRKITGQVNPVLTFGYSGFLGSDNAANSVSKAPVIATTATATSAGGLYPITASGGTSANYLFVYLKGTMKVETFSGSYEALFVNAGTQRPAAKLELTVAASSKTFTAKLTTPTETAAVALNGTLEAPSINETVTGTATVKKGANTYLVNVNLPLTGDFTAEAKLNGNPLGTAANGRKLLTLATGQTLSYIGTHSALLAPATAGAGVPAGAGWAVATIDAKGLLKLTGKLADGTGLTASLAADVSSHPGYRLFVQPYTPARTGTFIAGAFTLKPQLDPGLIGRRYVAFEDGADLTWVKAPRSLDTSYRAGFGPVNTRFTLDPWLPPAAAKGLVPAITLTQRLGLTANQFTAQHSAIISASFIDLPTTLGLNATTNVVSVSVPLANAAKWKVTLTPATGAFVGSFELNDDGKKRAVPFTGMMRQPPSTDPSGLIGDGNFQLPSLTPAPNNEVLSGEVGFEK